MINGIGLAFNTEAVQNVVNKLTSIGAKELDDDEINKRFDLSITTANIQDSVNSKLKPISQRGYGSLFEFLDKIDIMNKENQQIMQNVQGMKKRLDMTYKLENLLPVANI